MSKSKTYRFAAHALDAALLSRIRQAEKKPVPITTLIQLAKQQGFPPSETRYRLHKLAQAGEIRYSTNPTAFEVLVVEGDE